MSFGESHGPAMGVVIDGCPAKLQVDPAELERWLQRRAPGRLPGVTARREEDRPQILSGVWEGQTLGTPIAVMVKNQGQRSEDYKAWRGEYRPGHADRTTELKYGIRDFRGGGRASGRETLARVIAGHFASLILPQVHISSWAQQIGPLSAVDSTLPPGQYGLPGRDEEVEKLLLKAKEEGDSYGGVVVIKITSMPVGLGEPAFDKLKADLAKALLSVGAVMGVHVGLASTAVSLSGKELAQRPGAFGGIEGGISNGDPVVLEVLMKPPSTVGEKAQAGRHDPCLIPRARPVLESMVYCVLADHYLRQRAYQ